MKRIYASVLILVSIAFAIHRDDDEVGIASLFSKPYEVSFVKSPSQTDCDACLASQIDQLDNAHITEFWSIPFEMTARTTHTTVQASFAQQDVAVPTGRAPPAIPAVPA